MDTKEGLADVPESPDGAGQALAGEIDKLAQTFAMEYLTGHYRPLREDERPRFDQLHVVMLAFASQVRRQVEKAQAERDTLRQQLDQQWTEKQLMIEGWKDIAAISQKETELALAEREAAVAALTRLREQLQELAVSYEVAGKLWRKGQMTREKSGKEMCEQAFSDLTALLGASEEPT